MNARNQLEEGCNRLASTLLTDNLPLLAGATNGIKKLRELILELAVRGKLVPQDPSDEPASELLKRIAEAKAQDTSGRKKSSEQGPSVSGEISKFDLPSGWRWVRFGDIAQHNSGKTLDKGRNTGVARDYITTSNLYWGRFELANVRQMLMEESDLARCTATRNDLLSCEGGEAGRAAVWDQEREICFQNHVHRARFYGGVHPYYAQRYFEKLNYSGEISGYRKGVGISNMSSKSLASITMPLPPTAEQHRIVAKVDELMALCDRLEAQQADAESAHAKLVQALLDSLTQACASPDFAASWQRLAEHFHALFTTEASIDALKQTLLQLAVMGKLEPQDSRDEPASDLLEVIVNEIALLHSEGKIRKPKPIDPISTEEEAFETPKGWKWVRLSQITRQLGDGLHGTPIYSQDGEYYFVNGNNLTGGKIVIKPETKTVSESEHSKHKKPLDEQSILVSINGTIGNIAFYNSEKIILGKSACYFNLASGVSKHFVRLLIEAPGFMKYALKSATGTTIKNLGLKAMNDYPIALPPLAEQHRIVAKVDQFMALCDQLKTRLTLARQLNEQLASTLVKQAVE